MKKELLPTKRTPVYTKSRSYSSVWLKNITESNKNRVWKIPEHKKAFIKNGICVIPLSGEHKAICDAEDYEKVKDYNWHVSLTKTYKYVNAFCKKSQKKKSRVFTQIPFKCYR
jgi:hypothetical protein